jgi:hypothetical protein
VNPKLLPIRLERFQVGRPLARHVFLNLPLNHKMLCVGLPGDELLPSLLARLPQSGVRELYARQLDAESPRNPETYPIHVDAGERALLQELGKATQAAESRGAVLSVPGAPGPIETRGRHDFRPADVVRAEAAAAAEKATSEFQELMEGLAAKRRALARALQEEKNAIGANGEGRHEERFGGDSGVEEERRFGSANPGEAEFRSEADEEPEDPFFPRAAVDEMRELYARDGADNGRRLREQAWRARGAESPMTESLAVPRDELPALTVRALGDGLVKTVREFALAGGKFNSPELKAIAGSLSELARVFYNVASMPDVAQECASRVLGELEEIRKELRIYSLRDGYTANERLHRSLAEAISCFRRGVAAE